MGARGPTKKSGAYLGLHGSRTADGRGIAMPPGTPRKPDWIAAKPIASRYWDETIAELVEVSGLLSTLDRDALALYCDSWQQFHDAQALVASQGMTCMSDKGGVYQHPAVGIANKARAEITKLGAMFGLNPVARDGMVVNSGLSEQDRELMELMRG